MDEFSAGIIIEKIRNQIELGVNSIAFKTFLVNKTKDIRCIIVNYFNTMFSLIVDGTYRKFQKDDLVKYA